MSVKTILESMTSRTDEGLIIKRPFNKSNFNKLIAEMLSDPDHVIQVPNIKGDAIESYREVIVSKDFRKFLKTMLERVGVDKGESVAVLDSAFGVTEKDVVWMYDFISAALTEYMSTGAGFEFVPRDDLVGTIRIKPVAAATRVREVIKPSTRESMGLHQFDTQDHREYSVKSSCPKLLKSCKKIQQ